MVDVLFCIHIPEGLVGNAKQAKCTKEEKIIIQKTHLQNGLNVTCRPACIIDYLGLGCDCKNRDFECGTAGINVLCIELFSVATILIFDYVC